MKIRKRKFRKLNKNRLQINLICFLLGIVITPPEISKVDTGQEEKKYKIGGGG